MATLQGDDPGPGRPVRVGVFVGTILVLIALAVLPLLTPPFVHAALDAAGSAGRLGLDAETVRALSDRSVEGLLSWSDPFDILGPDGRAFYDGAERSHLGEARVLLWACLSLGALALMGITVAMLRSDGAGRRSLWRCISRAGVSVSIAVLVIGAVAVVAFAQLFTLFHQVFFPGGNWSFDPATQRLVQLYPFAFWQIAALALGVLLLVLGLATWWLSRRMAARDWAPAGRHSTPPARDR
jgi:integral membrane protein (TIGR01906 family)